MVRISKQKTDELERILLDLEAAARSQDDQDLAQSSDYLEYATSDLREFITNNGFRPGYTNKRIA